MLKIIIQALISIGLIIFGISVYVSGNEMHWTYMLIVGGVLWLIADIYQLATYRKNQQKRWELPGQEERFVRELHTENPQQNEVKNSDRNSLTNPKRIALIPAGDTRSQRFQVLLNGNPIGETDAMNPLVFATTIRKNVLHVENEKGQKSLPFFFEVVEDGSGDSSLYIGYDSHGNLVVLLSAGLVLGSTVKGVKKKAYK